jgi:hypothetical protein
MRIFLQFSENGKTISNPCEFALPPVVRRFYPNFLVVEYSPLPSIDVSAEYWVPASNAVGGRLTLTNQSTSTRKIRLEVCALLVPLEGQSMTATQMQMIHVLAGETGGLFPVLFLTGGPAPARSPHPSLSLDLELGPGARRQFTWVQAATAALQTSFDLARQIAARPWDAERARIELLNASQTIHISTGDRDWDAAFALSQCAAFGLLFPSSSHLPYSSFVSSRQPDHGYSPNGDGSDYPASWKGQTPLEAFYLASVLPVHSVAKDLLRNFLSVQQEDGTIDGKPGLAAQRGRYNAAPLLASLAWQIYETTQDVDFLAGVFPGLLNFFWSWFSPESDADRDGIPQWKHVLQTGFEEHPLFDAWNAWSLGVDITQVHSPALEAMLHREADCLMRMAEALGRNDAQVLLREQAAKLRASVEASWHARSGLYHYRDRETGSSSTGKVLFQQKGEGTLSLKLKFESPVRLLIEVQSQRSGAKRPQIRLYQYATKAADEVISGGDYQWREGGLVYTTHKVYSKLAKVAIRHIGEEDTVTIRTLDLSLEDHTLFTPLWAGIPDEQHAQIMIGRALLDSKRFHRAFGVPACPAFASRLREAETVTQAVYLPWNFLIGEGLLRYGFRSDAARLFVRNMSAVIQNLKQNRAFSARYHAEKGTGIGERNALSGLISTGLFLKILGVEILSADCVRLEGSNPFAWDVIVEYRGLKVIRGANSTEVLFPNGKSVTVTSTESTIVQM